jgi:hypothetical protein
LRVSSQLIEIVFFIYLYKNRCNDTILYSHAAYHPTNATFLSFPFSTTTQVDVTNVESIHTEYRYESETISDTQLWADLPKIANDGYRISPIGDGIGKF